MWVVGGVDCGDGAISGIFLAFEFFSLVLYNDPP